MDAIRCSCGAMHHVDALEPIGRQQGLAGEYAELANCPSCGSTLCVRKGSGDRIPASRPSRPASAIAAS
jgi:hypothetical protein